MYRDIDDIALIKQHVLHETLLVVLDRDKRAIEESNIKIKEPYIFALDEAVKVAVSKAAEIKKEMNKKRIKILSSQKTDYGTKVHYTSRGYEDRAEFWGGNMRAEVWVLMNRYMFRKEQEEE